MPRIALLCFFSCLFACSQLELDSERQALACADSCESCQSCPLGTAFVAASSTLSTDDAEEKNGYVSLGSSDLELTEDNGAQIVGIRFPDLTVPAGATIHNATIEFTVDEVDTAAANLRIRIENSASALTFAHVGWDVSSRSMGNGEVAWSPVAWTSVGERQQTPNLASLLQAVVDRGDWSSGADVAFIIDGTGRRTAGSFEAGTGPRLLVDYTMPSVPGVPDVCGDGVCATSEDCSSCAADCGTCPDPSVATTVESAVAQWNDDAEELNGYMNLASSDLELTETSGPQTVGIRFAAVAVPPGATISEAHIQLTVDEIDTVATSLSIRAEATDDAASFTQEAYNISARSLSAGAVAWLPAAWTTIHASENTPDLAAIVQEVVARPGWNANAAMAFVITGSGTRTAESFESGYGARLFITYSLAASVCGDTVCSADESCSVCAADCGVCPTHGGSQGIEPTPITHIDCASASPLISACDYASIQAAINAASAGARVEVCAGSFAERLTINKNLCLIGIGGAAQTTINAGGSGRGITIESNSNVSISGFTVRNGQASEGGGISCHRGTLALSDVVLTGNNAVDGGGLNLHSCDSTITGIVVSDNTATNWGGGINIVESNGWLLDSTIADNEAPKGGGLFSFNGTFSIKGNTISGNLASLGGGGIYHFSNANIIDNLIDGNHSEDRGGGLTADTREPLILGNVVRNNTCADDGAGIYLLYSAATLVFNRIENNRAGDDAGGLRLFQVAAHIEANEIVGNHANDAGGGGKASHGGGLFLNNLFENNRATYGGGIEMDDDYSTIQGCIFRNNRAARGGGIHAFVVPEPFLYESSLFEGNRASIAGGAIDIESVKASGTLRFLTMIDNRAPSGAAISSKFIQPGAQVVVSSSIFDANQGETLSDEGTQDPFYEYNDFFPAATVSGMPAPSLVNGNISQDPLFADSTSYMLATTSPCIDAGDPGLQDQDSSRADMGAYGGQYPLE